MNTLAWAIVVVAGFLAATVAGTPVIRGLFKFVDWQTQRAAARREAAVAGTGGPELVDLRLERAGRDMPGGTWIGLLERVGIYSCIVAGFPAGVAIVLGVKGFGRYPELSTPDPAKSERFIIGTLGSLLWAAAWGALVSWLR